jgi:hypothetical protein
MIAIEKPTRIDRDPILIRKSIRDFYVKTGSRLKNRNPSDRQSVLSP